MKISEIRNSVATHVMCRYSNKFDDIVKTLYKVDSELKQNQKKFSSTEKIFLGKRRLYLIRSIELETQSFEQNPDNWKVENSDNDYGTHIVLKIQKPKKATLRAA